MAKILLENNASDLYLVEKKLITHGFPIVRVSKAVPHQSSNLEKNKEIIRNFVQDLFNRHDIQAADKYFPGDPKQFKQFLSGFFQRFSDSHTKIDHILAEDDKVMVMITGTGTDNQTGKQVTLKAADLYRIENCTIAEHWDVVDRSEIS